MKILVTGAAGYIGSQLAERLAEEGHEVIGIDCFTPYYPRILKDLNAESVKAKGIKLFEIDLATDDLTQAVDGVEVIYHLAAQPGISSKVPFEDYVKNNVVATQKLLEAVKNLPTLKMFVNTGTSSIYGLNAEFAETQAPQPASYYGVTKLAAEQLVLAYNRDQGMPACSLRLYSVYGERERPEKLYPRLYRSIFTDYEFPLFEGATEHVRSYTYVGDIIDGFVAVLDHLEECNGEIFNIGLDSTITTGEAIAAVEKVTGKKAKFTMKPRRAGDQYSTKAVIDKARKILGYNPTTTPEEGFAKSAAWYEQNIVPLLQEGKLNDA